MKHHSAGGILIRRGKALEFLVVKHVRYTGEIQWVSPKGHLEPGETAELAARREVAEEVGYKQVNNIQYMGDQVFSYFESGEAQEKTISWFLMEIAAGEGPVLNKAEGFIEAKWLPYEEAILLFTHAEFRQWVVAANQMLTANLDDKPALT